METSTEAIVARRPVALAVLLLLAFGLSGLALLPVIVGVVSPTSTVGKVFLLLVAIGSPGIAAFVVAGLFAGRPGVSALLRKGGRWRVGIRWQGRHPRLRRPRRTRWPVRGRRGLRTTGR